MAPEVTWRNLKPESIHQRNETISVIERRSLSKNIDPMKYVATDGTVFTDRSLYRKHEMETQYTFREKRRSTLTKMPGSILGQPFDIIDCQQCKILLLDYCDQVQIDDVSDSKIFIGASSGSIFVRNCKNCTFTVACKQLRTRDCHNCTFNLYCKTDPVIETSTDMKFAPFNGVYPGLMKAMRDADLDPSINKWHAVFDFNDPSETQENWRLLLPDEREPKWEPLCDADPWVSAGSDDTLVEHDINEEVGVEAILTMDNGDCGDNIEQSSSSEEESGHLHKIKVFGCRAFRIISETVYSIQAFCLGFIFSGLQMSSKMISQR